MSVELRDDQWPEKGTPLPHEDEDAEDGQTGFRQREDDVPEDAQL